MVAPVLIIGARGFIGSNLTSYLKAQSRSFLAMSRKAASESTFVYGDLEDQESLSVLLDQVQTVFYLSHSMDESDQFFETETRHAKNLADLLNNHHRVIYLSGLYQSGKDPGPHLSSRKAVGEIFEASAAEVIIFRASIVIGDYSASFEMIRALVMRLPFFVQSSWSQSLCQPIAINDVSRYLFEAIDLTLTDKNLTIDIGGEDIVSYGDLLSRYAAYLKLWRPVIHFSRLDKTMAEKLLIQVVPEYRVLGKNLFSSIDQETIVENTKASELFDFRPMGLETAFAQTSSLEELGKGIEEQLRENQWWDHIPKHLLKEAFEIVIPVGQFRPIDRVYQEIKVRWPGKTPEFLEEGRLRIKVPFVGQFDLYYGEGRKNLFLLVNPEFAFQRLFLVFGKNWYNLIKSYLS
jgi:uncharacterized protein YbjT (DUF2867 family)